MRSFLDDAVHGLRVMAKSPGFTAAAVLTLALGMGANTAVFSILDTLVLAPLPYAEPERVAFVLRWDVERQERGFAMPLADVLDLRSGASSLEEVAAYLYWSANLSGGDRPERVQGYRVTGNTFALLGVDPLLGRTLGPEDARPGSPAIAVISHALWERRFGGDPTVVGRDVHIDGEPFEIVGVMPRRFEFPVFNFKGDLWAPLPLDPTIASADRRAAGSAVAIARVRRGVPYPQAQAEIDTVMRRLEADHPTTNQSLGARLIEMKALGDEIVGPVAMVSVAAMGLVLLLACANVANLLLARGVARRRELAMRSALGAKRSRLVRQLLTEGLLLAVAGALLGTLATYWALGAFRASMPELLRRTTANVDELGIDGTVLLFTAALSIVTTVVFGLVPALRSAAPDLQDSLKEGTGATGGARHRRLRGLLVAAEVALSVVLLVAAGLLVRSYQRLQRTDTGFDADGLATFAVTLSESRHPSAERQRLFFEQAVERLAALPGAQGAAFANVLPFSTFDRGTRLVVEGQAAPEPGREPSTGFRIVTPGYFSVLRIPVHEGRGFGEADGPQGVPVAIVNQTLARQLWGDLDPIGRRIAFITAAAAPEWRTVVGVSGDVLHSQLVGQPGPEVYVPFAQMPTDTMMLALRTAGDPAALAGSARGVIEALDAQQPVFLEKTMRRLRDDALLPQASATSIVGLFGALALILAGMGVYSVIAYVVTQQTREIGLRIALGATARQVLRLLFVRVGVTLGAGAAVGLVGAVAAAALMARLPLGVVAADPVTYAAVVGLLAAVALAACLVPARRAIRVDPVDALRG